VGGWRIIKGEEVSMFLLCKYSRVVWYAGCPCVEHRALLELLGAVFGIMAFLFPALLLLLL
jgi:hypothetical protein